MIEGGQLRGPDVIAPWEPGQAISTMVFKPAPCRTRWEGVAITSWLILIDMLMLIWAWRRPVDWMKFALILLVVLSVPLIVHLAYRTWAVFSLEYWIDRNSVTVHWVNSRLVIPLDRVQRLIRGDVENLGKAGWLEWPGPHLGGKGRALGLVNITMLATRPLESCLLLETDDAVYALSPADEDGFLTAVQVRHTLGPVKDVQPALVRGSLWNRTLGVDSTGALLLGAGAAGALILFGVLMLGFQDLPDALAFHYNIYGEPDVVREKTALFLLPFIGLLAWLINGAWGFWMAFRGQRTGAYMLWGGAIIVQVFSFLALYNLMH